MKRYPKPKYKLTQKVYFFKNKIGFEYLSVKNIEKSIGDLRMYEGRIVSMGIARDEKERYSITYNISGKGFFLDAQEDELSTSKRGLLKNKRSAIARGINLVIEHSNRSIANAKAYYKSSIKSQKERIDAVRELGESLGININ